MKKHLTILSYAMMMFMAFTVSFSLTSCGEEVSIDSPLGPGKDGLTVFSSVSDGTRTTIDNKAVFYWQSKIENGVQIDDQIWVDEAGTGASFSLKSASSEFETDKRTGKFYFRVALNNKNGYKLSYTGLNSTTGDEVTIKNEQLQEAWDDANHIGTSGDCATAEATADKDAGGNYTGNYSFTLEHKSSYLIFQPYAPASTDLNQYHLTGIEIVDTEDNALAGTFPLKYDGLKTSGATNTSARVRVTCGTGLEFRLPTTASKSVYAVILPRGAADGGRALQVRYHVTTVSDGNFTVYQNISGAFEENGARLIKYDLSVPAFPTVPTIVSDGNGRFATFKFKPAFLRRTNGNATVGATLQFDSDPFILLQHNQGAHGVAITEFQKRMFFTWNELAEIFGHADQGQGANWANTTATAANITKSVTIDGTQYTMPLSGYYTKLIETPNAGRATVNYYPASYAAVIVDLSADATYKTLGWDRNAAANANANASHIAGYLFFPDESVILDQKILVASLNSRWSTTASNLTADEIRNYVSHGCMFLPAVGNNYLNSWGYRGNVGNYWSGTLTNGQVANGNCFAFRHDLITLDNANRMRYYPVVLVEN